MKEIINRKDINGIQLMEGDIVAECKKMQSIWDGRAIVVERPIGVVRVYKNPKFRSFDNSPEETDAYNIFQIRTGLVRITSKAQDWVRDRLAHDGKYVDLHLSTYDGRFYNWDNIEKIGSIYDLDDYKGEISDEEVYSYEKAFEESKK